MRFALRRGAATDENPSDRIPIGGRPPLADRPFRGIRQALRELGYVEGQNITIEYRYAEGKLDHAPELTAELVRLKVDIIVVAGGDLMIRTAKKATNTIPIVMAGGAPILLEQGSSPALPVLVGTSLALQTFPETSGKRLELLKETVPKLARVAVFYEPTTPETAHQLKEVQPSPRGAEIDSSASGGSSPERFREGIRCAPQAAS